MSTCSSEDMLGLHGNLLASAARHGEKVVFEGRGERTTYAALEDRATRLASTLRALGVARGDRVAIVLDGDVDYLVAFYGALIAGAAAVPLGADTRTEPLVRALAHSGARVAILGATDLRWLEGQAARVPALHALLVRGEGVLADRGHLELVRWQDALRAPRGEVSDASGGELAALIYTSGTTGDPKGVMLSHANLVANTRSIVEYLELTADDTVGMVLPFHYAYGNSVLHTHVAVGGTVVQVGSMTFVAQVVENLARAGCTGFSGVPATFARLLSYRSFHEHDLRRLRYLTQAGAAMTPALALKLREAFPAARVYVMYGQTEASARLSYVPPERLEEKLGSAGKAIPGVTLAICDAAGRELPRGTLGEVVARGDNVMLGYFEDREGTARVLRPEGLRTGDLGTMDEDGFLFLQGRDSELVKSGGHRISPLVIESAVAHAPGVHECAVTGVPDEVLGEAIVAYVVPEPGATLARKPILDACHLALPKHEMPSAIYVVDELPHHPQTGKLQRRVLREWHAAGRGARL